MALYDLVRCALTSSGTGTTLTLGPAVTGYRSFSAAAVPNGAVVSVGIEDASIPGHMTGSGIYSSSGGTIAFTLISSSTGAMLSLTTAATITITPLAGDLTPASAAKVIAGTDASAPVTSAALAGAQTFAPLTDAATIAVDFSTLINAQVTLAGNRTLGAPTNLKDGQSGLILVAQDGTGSRTLSYASAWKFAGGVPTLSTTANTVDAIAYVVRGTLVYANLLKAFA